MFLSLERQLNVDADQRNWVLEGLVVHISTKGIIQILYKEFDRIAKEFSQLLQSCVNVWFGTGADEGKNPMKVQNKRN